MAKVDIKDIEKHYKSFYDVKKINKKTRKWKKFYNNYRSGRIVEHKILVHPKVGKLLEKEKKSKVRSNSMTFNKKHYVRGSRYYDTKEDAKRSAKINRKDGNNAIIDKRKNGYFLWINMSRKK